MVVFAVQALTEGKLDSNVGTALMESKIAHNTFLGTCNLLRTAVRQNLEVKEFSTDIQQIMPKEFATILCKAYKNRLDVMRDFLSEKARNLSLPGLASLRWRVDVTISTTSLSRVFRPVVLMSLTLSDGQIVTFETSVEKLNELRYCVAKLLKLTLDFEKHPMLTRDL
eukprot:CAMPEP_0167751148 /NCGR_PEP_ID=MMETSP0110_2-20121227/6397_1 /TAXON_ID=629695 /ORGANISM="Gymnochlora sp., Strain CCMP2014" /LENGTH=167 /DNA_ID=CAMNT_0007636571 /DNA_START=135 /DNA_END=641 /DNA_ORIENTATION=-